MTDTGQARRVGDKTMSFILFMLIVFLANWLIGCTTPPERRPAYVLKCGDAYWKDDVRCSKGWYAIPEEMQYDSTEEITDEEFE